MSTGFATDERVQQIIDFLTQGFTREELAQKLGLRTRKSMDQYMRRHGYLWDPVQGTYQVSSSESPLLHSTTTRALEVIAQFNQQNADAKEIAKRLHFVNHYEMAQYMQARGYQWSNEAQNYGARNEVSTKQPTSQTEESDSQARLTPGDYHHLLGFLLKNESKLVYLLDQTVAQPSEIPRYLLPGGYTVKSIHMVAELDRLVKIFSQEKNISQREIFEVALIHFFKTYGFGSAVDGLLGKN